MTPPLAFSIPTATGGEQRRLFSDFRANGFDGLQLKGGQYARYVSEPERFREEWGHEPGATSALIAGGTLDQDGQSNLRHLFAFAQAVGTERIVFCHGRPRLGVTTGDLREYARILGDLGQEARERNLRLSLHHHYDQPVMHREDLTIFFEAVPDGTVGLTLDTAHLWKSGVHDIAAVIYHFNGILDNVHLKDFAGGEFQTLGRGEIPFGPIFAALRRIGYAGWLCADEESGAEVVEGMTAAHAFITENWSKPNVEGV